MTSQRRLLPVLLLGIVLAGCAEPATIPPLSSRPAAPEIRGSDSSGKELKLSDYRGKVVLIDFWRDT